MMRMDNGYSHIIQTARLYFSHLKRILIYPQDIDTQEGNPVFFDFMTGGTGSIPNEH